MRALTMAVAVVVASVALGACGPTTTTQRPPRVIGEEPPVPAPAVGDMGSIPADKVEALNDYFTKKGVQVSRCYQAELERRGDRSFVGKVSVKLRISKAGKASDIEIMQNTLKAPSVEQCIIEEMKGWSMPELPNAIMWTWTFEFQPAW
jgi:hypothetical protein